MSKKVAESAMPRVTFNRAAWRVNHTTRWTNTLRVQRHLRSRHVRAPLLCGALLFALLPGMTAAEEFNLPYPRLANVYLVGSVQPELIPRLARYDILVLNSIWADELLAEIRSLNHDIKIYLYICHYCVESPPNPGDQWNQKLHGYCDQFNLWWYNRFGNIASDWPGSRMINITSLGAPGPVGTWQQYLVNQIEWLVNTHPQIDGIYFDNFWRWVSWEQPRIQVDSDCNPLHNPAGCNGVMDTPALLDTLWNTALRTLAQQTRQRFDYIDSMHPNRKLSIVGSRPGDYYTWLNGGMYENWPKSGGYQDPGLLYRYNFNQEMFEYPEGYVVAPTRQDPYSAQIINAGSWGTPEEPSRNPDFERYKRFTLGATLLGDGYYSLDNGSVHLNYWWEPEYDLGGKGKGYLGYPLGPYFVAAQPTGFEMIGNASFTAGQTNWFWQNGDGLQGNFTIDNTEFHSAPAAARIDVTSTPPNGWSKLYQTIPPITNLGGYTLSFWAKASVEMDIQVHIYADQCPGSRCLKDRNIRLTTSWQKFHLPFVSSGTAPSPGVNVFTNTVGTVWLDDFSYRTGDTSVYRRDFDNGIVLVNYTTEPVAIPLGGTFYRMDIHGWAEYDGAAVTTEIVPPSDGRILLRVPGGPTDAPAPRLRTQLLANEPNPFNPSTRVRFHLEQGGEVQLGVYDVAGRPVRRLFEGRMEAGSHALTWDGTDDAGRHVASGVYYGRFESGGVVQSRAMTLVK